MANKPERYHSVTPTLFIQNASRFIDFAKQVFGAEEVERYSGPGGTILHSEIQIGDSIIMTGDSGPTFLVRSKEPAREMAASHCEVAVRLAARLGMSSGVTKGLDRMYERWDGKGFLGKEKGEAVPLVARLTQLAHVTEIYHRLGGREAATEVVRRRSGGQFDPEVANACLSCSRELLAPCDEGCVNGGLMSGVTKH